jgi:hypothetical protein
MRVVCSLSWYHCACLTAWEQRRSAGGECLLDDLLLNVLLVHVRCQVETLPVPWLNIADEDGIEDGLHQLRLAAWRGDERKCAEGWEGTARASV